MNSWQKAWTSWARNWLCSTDRTVEAAVAMRSAIEKARIVVAPWAGPLTAWEMAWTPTDIAGRAAAAWMVTEAARRDVAAWTARAAQVVARTKRDVNVQTIAEEVLTS